MTPSAGNSRTDDDSSTHLSSCEDCNKYMNSHCTTHITCILHIIYTVRQKNSVYKKHVHVHIQCTYAHMYAVHAQFNTCTCAYNVIYMYMSHMLYMYMYSVHELHVHKCSTVPLYSACSILLCKLFHHYREKANSIGRRPTV